MHDTALASGKLFSNNYGSQGNIVLDIGGKNTYGNVDGTLRRFFEDSGMKYISLDIEHDISVDIVVKPGDK